LLSDILLKTNTRRLDWTVAGGGTSPSHSVGGLLLWLLLLLMVVVVVVVLAWRIHSHPPS